MLTNGCFDIVHAGHVRYLEAARSLGDVLVVAVNSDASVRDLKEPGRPINREQDRLQVVAGLGAVDLVTLFADRTAEVVAEKVIPDVYVKGGDYSADPDSDRFPIEGHMVLSTGGEVRIIELVQGYSTSDLITRIRAASS